MQTDHDQIDPQLESLLDQALAVSPPAGLADRIVAATESQLGADAPAVLGRIGRTMLAMAAAVAIALGAAAWLAVMQLQTDAGGTGPGVEMGLAHLVLDTSQGADIDEQITLLTLQVDLAESDDWWAPAGEGLDRSMLQYQLEALSSDEFAIF